MKTALGILSLAGMLFASAHGQSIEASITTTNQPKSEDALHLAPELTPQQIEAMIRFQTEIVSRVFGVNVAVDGVVPRMLRADQPLQLLNPLAPPEYGFGADLLSVDLLTHRVQGVSFFTFRF